MNFSTLSARFGLFIGCLGLLMAPAVALADGYAPLNLPPRGAGPTPSVQGESIENENNSNGENGGDEASPSATPTSNGEAEENQSSTITGSIKEVQNGTLVLDVDGVEREVSTVDDVKVMRDGQEVALSEIQTGDTATVERNDEGEVTEIRVASEQAMDFWRSFLPILLIVLIAFYFLTRKRGPKTA